MDCMLFHLETISDEDVREIVGSLNLSTSRTREELIWDILSYYAHVEGFEEQSSPQENIPAPNSTGAKSGRVQTNGKRRPSIELLQAALRGISRLDHPTCTGSSRYLDRGVNLGQDVSEVPSRASLRSVLRRWEEIGYVEEQSREIRRHSHSLLGDNQTSNQGQNSSHLGVSSDTVTRHNEEFPNTLVDFGFHIRSSQDMNLSPENRGSAHFMHLRSQNRASNSDQLAHQMRLRQRRLPIVETNNQRMSDARPLQSFTRETRSQSRGSRSNIENRSVDVIMNADVEYWLDIHGTLLGDGNSPLDIEYMDLFSESGEEEEFDELAEIEDDYGLETREIRERTVEGRFRAHRKSYCSGPPSNTADHDKHRNMQNEDHSSLSCPICLENFNENERIRTLPCFHIYHVRCIDRWLKSNSKCPICKNNVM